jgi:hypothetical protein
MRSLVFASLAGAGLMLAACHSQKKPANSLDAIDNKLVDGAVVGDNAATRALAKDILVDPHAKGHGKAPRTLAANEDGSRPGACLQGLAYANDWAKKLPADLPMHPQAKLEEAAGHDGACKARVVSFAVPGDRAAVIGWYAQKAKAAGYSADRADKNGDWNLAGSKPAPGGDAVYYIIAGATRNGATPVDYVWAQGG